MENLVNKIQEILDINVTSYRISKITGITELVLSKYRKGTYNIKNMSLETADKLISNISEIEKYAKWTEKIKCKQIEENLKGRYKMTFEEAIEVSKVISTLQETYAPKIKMTSEQKEEFMAFVNSPDDTFENFSICLGSGDSWYKNKISEGSIATTSNTSTQPTPSNAPAL